MPVENEMLLLRPAQLLEGDMVDLEGDSVADTDQTDAATRMLFEAEYVLVEGYEVETPACVRVDTDSGSWGFPTDHELRVCRRREVTLLPPGYSLEQDGDGDWILVPPEEITIFSSPGEGWLVTDNYMQGRSRQSRADVEQACLEYLRGRN